MKNTDANNRGVGIGDRTGDDRNDGTIKSRGGSRSRPVKAGSAKTGGTSNATRKATGGKKR